MAQNKRVMSIKKKFVPDCQEPIFQLLCLLIRLIFFFTRNLKVVLEIIS